MGFQLVSHSQEDYSALQVGCQFANANRKSLISYDCSNYSIVVIAGQRAFCISDNCHPVTVAQVS